MKEWVLTAFNMLDIPPYPVSIIGPTMVGSGENILKIKVPYFAILRLEFCYFEIGL